MICTCRVLEKRLPMAELSPELLPEAEEEPLL
jgi:hypothetical protein